MLSVVHAELQFHFHRLTQEKVEGRVIRWRFVCLEQQLPAEIPGHVPLVVIVELKGGVTGLGHAVEKPQRSQIFARTDLEILFDLIGSDGKTLHRNHPFVRELVRVAQFAGVSEKIAWSERGVNHGAHQGLRWLYEGTFLSGKYRPRQK